MTCRTMTRMKINAEIVLEENDHEEMSAILEKVFADAKPEMKVLLKSQLDALKSPLHGRRWPREVISTALSLWLRSPGGYDELKASDMIILPSGRQLQRYKNTIFQTPGLLSHRLRADRKSTRLNSSHMSESRMPSSA